MNTNKFLIFVAFCAICAPAAAQCPPGPNQVSVQVVANVQRDAATGEFIYRYEIENLPSSLQEVDWFAIEFADSLSDIRQPTGWRSGPYANGDIWSFHAAAVAEPERVRDDASVPSSIVQIKPSESLAGFGFTSSRPPGPVRYYVTGFVDLPATVADDPAEAELLAETLVEECPELGMPILEVAVSGITTGPASDDFIPVTLDIKPGSFPNSINPDDHGVIPVAILGTGTFDVSQVDQASVRFGPGQAKPHQDRGRFENINDDGITDLVFHFQTEESQIECSDSAAFLTGSTLEGRAIQGFDSVRPVPCKP